MRPIAKRRHRLGLFSRFLLSYLAVVAILLGVMSFVILDVFMRDFEEKAKANNTDKLEQLRQVTDVQLYALEHTLVTEVALDSSLTPFQLGLDAGRGYGITRILNAYRSHNAAVYDVALYYGEGKTVYSGAGAYSLADYFTRHFVYRGVPAKKLQTLLTGLRRPTMLGDHAVAIDNGLVMHLLTYFYPVLLSNQETLTIALFIDASQFGSTMSQFTDSAPGYLLVFDHNGQPLYVSSSPRSKAISPNGLRKIGALVPGLDVRSERPTLLTIMLGRVRYTATFIPSATASVVYGLVIPESEYTQDIRSVTNMFIIAIASIFLLGFLLALFFSRRTYAPFAELRGKLATPADGLPGHRANGDEIESIGAHVDQILAENRELSAQVRQDKIYVRDQLLLRLLNGRSSPGTDTFTTLSREGIALEGAEYIVLFVIAERADADRSKARPVPASAVIAIMEQEAHLFGHGYGLRLGDGHAAFVSCIEHSEAARCIDSFIQRVRQIFANKLLLTVAVGEACRSIAGIHRSYVQARTAALHRFQLGRDRVIHHHDIAPEPNMPIYIVLKNQRAIEKLIRQGSYDELRIACNDAFQEIGLGHYPLDVAIYLTNSLLATVLRVVEELNVPLGPFLASINSERILLAGQFETIEDFRSYLLHLCRFVTDRVALRVEQVNTPMAERMVGFVEENFAEPQMSLKFLADSLQLSPSYISRVFRIHTGQTIMRYVAEKRMRLCKQMLVETDLPLAEIVRTAGYLDKNSFIRKFRLETGVTPMSFRAEHADGTTVSSVSETGKAQRA